MRFGVLFYVNRSGSTLASRMFDDLGDDLFVFPETAFLLDLLVERSRGRRLTGDALFETIRRDRRFGALGLADATLRSICARNNSNDPAALLQELATACRGGHAPVAIMFKLEGLLAFHRTLRALFPGLVMMHAVRDPRAAINSMLRTPVPEKPGFDMARGDIVFAARHWRDYVRRVAAIAHEERVFQIRYEELGDPSTLSEPARALGLNVESLAHRTPDGPGYIIGELDRELHPNVFRAFQIERVTAWTTQLPAGGIETIERICGREMVRMGYPPIRPPQRPVGTLRATVDHWRASTVHGWRTLAVYLTRPDGLAALRRRLHLALRSRADRVSERRARRPS